jgi:hypothetical protein
MGGSPEDELAELIAEAAARRNRGEPVARGADDAVQLVMQLGANGDDAAFDRFFARLAAALSARGASLPPLEELPPSVVPLLAGFEHAMVVDADGALDVEQTARQADGMLRRALGTSPRQMRESQLRAKIRSEVEAKVAASLRRHGLVPACDAPADDGGDPAE